MAISLKDIREKEFATQATDGYSVEQVDDFLDEITEQMSALVRENMEMGRRVQALEADLKAAREEVTAAQAKVPDYDEDSYFQNLRNSVRESLISAQRIADETTEEASRKAKKIEGEAQASADELTQSAQSQADALVAKAREQAEQITAEAQTKVAELERRYEALKTSAGSFKAEFSRMLDQQAAALKETSELF